jgi:hypothetical protein
MGRRSRKPPVKPEVRRAWLRRYEEDGESPPQIATTDSFDVRTVRKQIELARQEREVKEARSTVLRNALERHYADLCGYAERLNAQVLGQTAGWSHLDEHLRAALRQHLPRSPIWGYLNQRDSLQQGITQHLEEAGIKVVEGIKSDSRLSSELDADEAGVVPGIIGALKFQIEQWTEGMSGLNLKNDLISEPAEERFVNLRYGFSQMGKVKKEHVRVICKVLEDWESRLKQWEEYKKLEKSFIELRRVEKNLRDELAVITLRRIVPGRCKYCPL